MHKLNKILWGIISLGISAIYRTDSQAAEYTISGRPGFYTMKTGDKFTATDDCKVTFNLTKTEYKTSDSQYTKTINDWVNKFPSCSQILYENNLAGTTEYSADQATNANLCNDYKLPYCTNQYGPTHNLCASNLYYATLQNNGTNNNPSDYTCTLCPSTESTRGKTASAQYTLYNLEYGSSIVCHQVYREREDSSFNNPEYAGKFTFQATSLESVNSKLMYCSMIKSGSELLISTVDISDAAKQADCYKNPTDGIDARGSYTYSDDTRCYYQ